MDAGALGGYPLVLRSPMVLNLLPQFLAHHLWNLDPQKGNANANNITLSAVFKAKPKLASRSRWPPERMVEAPFPGL